MIHHAAKRLLDSNRLAMRRITLMLLAATLGLTACSKEATTSQVSSSDTSGNQSSSSSDSDTEDREAKAVVLSSEYIAYELESSKVTQLDEWKVDGEFPIDRFLILRRIEGREYTLGERRPNDDFEVRREVSLEPFYIMIHELTQTQWNKLTKAEVEKKPKAAFFEKPDDSANPLSGLAFAELKEPLKALLEKGLSLPSASQWEAACKGRSVSSYSWGDSTRESEVAEFARVQGCFEGSGAAPVMSLAPSKSGLYDMHGNLWEFVADGNACGGSWADSVYLARSGNRREVPADLAHPLFGFRLIYQSKADRAKQEARDNPPEPESPKESPEADGGKKDNG